MSSIYLIDANVLFEVQRARPNPGVQAAMQRHQHEIATAAPVWHELLFGSQRLPPSSRRDALERFFETVREAFTVLPYDARAAEWHAAERVRLAALGRTPPFVDGQIAAIAYTNGLILVTANVADFREFNGLRLEDWRA